MVKLAKYLKGSYKTIAIVILLLIMQAVCDLALPQYTSNIVNVGIQQGGIESQLPDVIRENQFNKILIFVPLQDQDAVRDAYKMLKEDDYSEAEWSELLNEYPALYGDNIYKLVETDVDKLDQLKEIVKTPIMMVGFLSESGEEAQAIQAKIKEKIVAQMPTETDLENVDLFDILAQMPNEAIEQFVNEVMNQMSGLTDSLSDQMAISFVKTEYQEIGMDVASLQTNYLVRTGVKMLSIALFMMVCAVAVTFFAARVAATLGKKLRGNVFKQVLSYSDAEFDQFSTASLITRSTNDIQQVQMLVVMMLRILFYAPIIGIGGVMKVINTNTSMAWIIGVAVALIMVVVLFLFAVAMPKFQSLQKLVDKLNLVTREILTGIPVIRAFSREKHEEERFDIANKDLTKTNLFVNRVMAGMLPVMMLIMNIVTVMIVWFGAKGIDLGEMQVGDLLAFISYTMQIIMSFLMLTMMSIMLPRALVSVRRIDEVLTTKSSIIQKNNTTPMQSSKRGVVQFDHVSFVYKDSDEEVLSDINFVAEPGKTTAIIGSTGSGKSTLIKLIPRFFDATKGRITVDGVDVRDADIQDLRERIGYVPQKGVLFSGTIESNIKFAHPGISDERMENAARIAQAQDFIEEKSEKYASPIAQGGNNVSGGQRQRLSIARAIAKEPEIYIFDDSFSALDYKTDVALRKALKEETKDATVIIVAQRISTILHADQILVLDEGKIAGKGTHQELLKSCEVYRQIAMSQLSAEELDVEKEAN